MGAYHVVIPVSWPQLTELLLPAWFDVLAGRRAIAAFCDEFAPSRAYYLEPHPSWRPELPANYLTDIGWVPGVPFVRADDLRRSAAHAIVQRTGYGETGAALLSDAIARKVSAELSGPDLFCDNNHHRYYGRLHEAPHPQVAGTKNAYYFLRSLYSITYDDAGSMYHHAPTPLVEGELGELLEALFLSTRAIPGTDILRASPGFPAGNHDRILGLLAPREVPRLVRLLAPLEQHLRDRDPDDRLFPLFLDRARRAGEQGLALVTLQDGL